MDLHATEYYLINRRGDVVAHLDAGADLKSPQVRGRSVVMDIECGIVLFVVTGAGRGRVCADPSQVQTMLRNLISERPPRTDF